MTPFSCQSVQDQLSAFMDEELGSAQHRRIEEHLADCPRCEAELRRYRDVSGFFRQSMPSERPPSWPSIESELRERRTTDASRRWNRNAALASAAIAASLLLAIVFWTSTSNQGDQRLAQPAELKSDDSEMMAGMEMEPEHMLEFQRIMDDYLAKLLANPEQAEDFLLSQYGGRRVDPSNAETLVGYRPLIAQGLPEGYELSSSSVVTMPCCTCFKAVCRRTDGSTLVLFEHDDDASSWFGKRKSNMATCGETDCCLVELDSSIAATWKEGSRSITAVGARDEGEVTMLVKAFRKSSVIEIP